jgi:hypothetical protein
MYPFIQTYSIYMPYTIRKVPNKPCYRVYNKKSRKVFAKCSTKENAEKQLRFLRGLEYNSTFRKRVKVGIRRTARASPP